MVIKANKANDNVSEIRTVMEDCDDWKERGLVELVLRPGEVSEANDTLSFLWDALEHCVYKEFAILFKLPNLFTNFN